MSIFVCLQCMSVCVKQYLNKIPHVPKGIFVLSLDPTNAALINFSVKLLLIQLLVMRC